jgi:hypothetical protein
MARGDTTLIQELAASMRIRREPPDDPGRVAAEVRRRTLAWQQQQFARLVFPPFHFNQRAAECLNLMASLPTEDDVMRAMLKNHHRPLEPPTDWRRGRAPLVGKAAG